MFNPKLCTRRSEDNWCCHANNVRKTRSRLLNLLRSSRMQSIIRDELHLSQPEFHLCSWNTIEGMLSVTCGWAILLPWWVSARSQVPHIRHFTIYHTTLRLFPEHYKFLFVKEDMYKFNVFVPGRVFLHGEPVRPNKHCIAASLNMRTKLTFSSLPTEAVQNLSWWISPVLIYAWRYLYKHLLNISTTRMPIR